ncbi:hypothetical protein ACWFNS_18260 [Oerskovia enterophila]
MNVPTDDFFDRLHSAADAVPPSTLDLPVVLATSRRKATTRRVLTGAAAFTALAVVGVGVATGLPGEVAHELAPAASSEIVSTEIVHREIAPGITAVAEAATYELPDKTVVLDTGIETGAHGDRFLIISTVDFSAGGPFEDANVVVDPRTGEILDAAAGEDADPSQDPKDPAYIQQMADLGYAPRETQRFQVVVGDEAELRRLRAGAEPTTVLVPVLSSAAVVDTEDGQFVFGATANEYFNDEPSAFLSSRELITQADGTTGTLLLVPTLTIPERAQAPFALALTKETSFAPQATASIGDGLQATTACTELADGCAVSYDAQSRVAIRSQEQDPRWAGVFTAAAHEDVAVLDSAGNQILFRCRGGDDGTEASFREGLTADQEDRIITSTTDLTFCKVERSTTGDGSLRVGS